MNPENGTDRMGAWQADRFCPVVGRLLIAVLAGVSVAIAFPPFEVSGLAWIAPGLMLLACVSGVPWPALVAGFASGLAMWLVLLHWLVYIPVPGLPVAGWIVLSVVLALFNALWGWWSGFILPCRVFGLRWDTACGGGCASVRVRWPMRFFWWCRARAGAIAESSWGVRVGWALLCAACWSTLELVRTHLLWGFPWTPLGASQYRLVPLIQVASVAGVYGVSFLVVWTGVALCFAAARLIWDPTRKGVWGADLALPVLVLCGVWIWGWYRIGSAQVLGADRQRVRLALVQPSIPQRVIWDAAQIPARKAQLLRLTAQALGSAPDLVIWPEAALPEYDEELISGLITMLRTNRTWMILGADDVETDAASGRTRFYNAAVLLSPDGSAVAVYRKRRLVPFGEFVPFRSVLPFLKWLTPVPGDFAPGAGPVRFHIPGKDVSTSVLICFEDTFPDLARASAAQDVDFLLNLTNDGWFGQSAAQFQHLVSALFRAVETGMPLVRCANNGVTCCVNGYGVITDILRDQAGSVYAGGVLEVELQLGAGPGPTLYLRYGDVFAMACTVAVGLGIVRAVGVVRKKA